MAVIDIRGTNGSGKSWLVRQLLIGRGVRDLEVDGALVGYVVPALNTRILGRYTETGGGCDGIKGGAVEVDRLVRVLTGQDARHVVLEGIMVSHLFERFDALARDVGDYRFLFLDTPWRVCVARVEARRREKGNTKPFDPYKNLIPDYQRVRYRVYNRLKEEGRYVRLLNYKDPLPQLLLEIARR